MGEAQGSIWSVLLFMTIFFGMITMLYWALDIMKYYSGVYTIEDNLKAENYDVFDDLDDNFKICLYPTIENSTEEDCSGIVEINETKRYIKYQVSYDGLTYNKSASGSEDHLVILPY